MKKILHIKSSARSIEDGSFSRFYGQKLLQKLYKKYANEEIFLKERDLMIKKPSFMSDFYLHGDNFDSYQKKAKSQNSDAMKESNEIIDEIFWADEIILECPMYNFSMPANVKAYFDLLIILDKTFTKDYKGLVFGKKVYIVSSFGGYNYQTDKSHLNFHTPLLKLIFKFIGFEEENIKFLLIEKTSQKEADSSNADEFLKNFS